MPVQFTRRSLLARIAAAFLLTSSITAAAIAVTMPVASAQNADRALDAFFNSGFGYCDAEVLSKYWRTSIDRAKVDAGAKILRGDRRVLRDVIRIAKRQYRCSTGFNSYDARAVAALWTATPE